MGVCFVLLLAVCLAGGGCGKGTQDGMDDGRGGSEDVSDREKGGAAKGRRDGDGDSGVRQEPADASRISEPTATGRISEPTAMGGIPKPTDASAILEPTDAGGIPEPAAVSLICEQGETLEERFLVPDGYGRKKREQNTLTAFLREYPLKKAGRPVLLYDGSRKGNQSAHAAVFKLPIENEDLQQCADSIMRVYAEYFWRTKQFEKISFSLGGGFQADYSKWRQGYTISVSGDTARWVPASSSDGSYQSLKKYLRLVFAYSGTATMEGETKKIAREDIRVGDVFLKGGSPGHVVMVVDVCEREDGAKAFLLGQGYMPAQEFHVLKNPRHEEDPWYYEEEVEYPFETPEYTFERGSLRRLVYGA